MITYERIAKESNISLEAMLGKKEMTCKIYPATTKEGEAIYTKDGELQKYTLSFFLQGQPIRKGKMTFMSAGKSVYVSMFSAPDSLELDESIEMGVFTDKVSLNSATTRAVEEGTVENLTPEELTHFYKVLPTDKTEYFLVFDEGDQPFYEVDEKDNRPFYEMEEKDDQPF